MSVAETLADSPYPLAYEASTPDPIRIPAPSDELYQHVRTHYRGANRITVAVWVGGKRYSQLNAIKLGAKHDENPRATIEEICRAITAVGQEHYEEVDQACKFRVQITCYKSSNSEPKRKTCHFEIGTAEGYGGDYLADSNAPENLEVATLDFAKYLMTEYMSACTTIAEMGKVAIENTASVFQERERAIAAQAEAHQTILDVQREGEASRANQAKWDKGFALFEKALNQGIAQAIVSKATNALSSPSAPTSSPTTSPQGRTVPSWAGGPSKKPQTQPPPTVDTTAVTVDNEPSDGEDEDPPEGDLVASTALETGKKLYNSISAKQWPKLAIALTKKQLTMLERLDESTSDEQTLAAVKDFKSTFKKNSMSDLAKILSVNQIAAILTLNGQVPDDD